MATRTISLRATTPPQLFPYTIREAKSVNFIPDLSQVNGTDRYPFSWERLSATSPLVHMLQPDYYMVFRYTAPGVPVFQHNLHLDFGQIEVSYSAIVDHIHKNDQDHLRRMDRVKEQFVKECRLQPFDYISSILIRWVSPEGDHRYFMRKQTVLLSDSEGLPAYGIVTIKDITPMVSAIKPNNVDITFHPDKANLCYELIRRIKAVQPKPIGITARELDIVRCLCKGMSSKEIAAVLFISKATVDTHRQNLIHKWEVTNTAALLQRAMEEGCI